MSAGLDRQIFSDAGRPEEGEASIAPGHVDEAVSRAIRNIDRPEEELPQDEPQPRQRQQPQQRDPLEGIEDRSNSGLLKALLDERDKRQRSDARAERYAKLEEEQARQNGRVPISERLFTHPQETLDELRREWTQPLESQLAEMRVNQNFQMAHMRHGGNFEQAWQSWYEQVRDGKDATTYFGVMNSPDPGQAMVEWYLRRQLWEETGGDLTAYKQRIIDEYRNGGHRSEPPGPSRAPNGQFASRPQAPPLPTSIGRMGSPGRPADDDDLDNDGSDAAIFAAARPKRRR